MKYRILSVGVLIGARVIVTALLKKEDSKNKEKKFKVTIKDRETGEVSDVTVNGLDRSDALSKIDRTMKKTHIIRGIGRG